MVICPNCLQENRDNARFCQMCGNSLLEADIPSASLTPHHLKPGALIQGRYSVLHQIGEGGLGKVFLAEDQSGRKYALKQIREFKPGEDRSDQEIFMRSFQREAKILSSLPHPYLPIARDFIIDEGSFLIVMDYIEGRTLSEVLSSAKGSLPEERVLRWAIQVCQALSYLHNKKPSIIHRNIKPKNIILEGEGKDERVRLIGFGLSRFYMPGLEADEDQLGTPGYAPPEQFGDAQTDPRSDIYSLGATMHALLSGHDPDDYVQTMRLDQRLSKLTDLSVINPEITARTQEVIYRATQPNPGDRFQSAEEMMAELEEILQGKETSTEEELFNLHEPVPMEETRYCEFKEITGTDPLPAIKRSIEEYVVAFLNSDGGRILWGIRDADRVVTGVQADYHKRDVIRRLITDKVMRIQPSISPSALRINFHPILEGNKILEDLYILEVEVPRALTNFLYFTSDNRVYMKTEAGKKQLSGPEIQDEIIRRLQK